MFSKEYPYFTALSSRGTLLNIVVLRNIFKEKFPLCLRSLPISMVSHMLTRDDGMQTGNGQQLSTTHTAFDAEHVMLWVQ